MRILRYLLLAPVAALILAFAFANRDWVTINFDPTGLSGLESEQAPQFVVVLISAAAGVVAGGISTWIGQGRYRRAAREAQTEVARLRAELQSARLGGSPPLAR